MKRDFEFPLGSSAALSPLRAAPVWAVAFAVVGILVVYWQTAASIVAIWIRSETFAHGFIIIPICIWLTWRNRDVLARIPARPWWWGLVGVALAGALWLFASKAGAGVVRQFALAFMIEATIVTIVGIRQAIALAFPLAFFLFAVPTGEFLIPTLMEWTADFTVSALRASGVPVYREANYFVIPSGTWSVVEACAGLRYLIASLVIGLIYAVITYHSAMRRTMFIVASIIVPIVANWLRAYMIVMIGHLSSNKLATGIDHVIYGWLFFGLVMALLFWVGSFWREPNAPDRIKVSLTSMPVTESAGRTAPFIAAALLALVTSAVWQPLEATLGSGRTRGMPTLSQVVGTNGWYSTSGAAVDWKPDYEGYKAELRQTFTSNSRVVGLYVAYYRNQEKGQELVTSGNQLTMPKNWRWKQTAAGTDIVQWNDRSTTVGRVELTGPRDRIDVFALYWVDGRVTESPYMAKVLQAWSNLKGDGDDGALIAMYAPVTDGAGTRETLRAFASEMSPAIDRALAAARGSGH